MHGLMHRNQMEPVKQGHVIKDSSLKAHNTDRDLPRYHHETKALMCLRVQCQQKT